MLALKMKDEPWKHQMGMKNINKSSEIYILRIASYDLELSENSSSHTRKERLGWLMDNEGLKASWVLTYGTEQKEK